MCKGKSENGNQQAGRPVRGTRALQDNLRQLVIAEKPRDGDLGGHEVALPASRQCRIGPKNQARQLLARRKVACPHQFGDGLGIVLARTGCQQIGDNGLQSLLP